MTTQLTTRVSIVIPVYRSARILPTLVARLEAALQPRAGEVEVILVNDGSPDDSWEVLRGLARGRPWMRGLNLWRNYGQHNALLCGIRAARHPVIVTMDDDLQHPPEVLPELVAALTDDVDVVYGVPERETHGLFRDIASVTTKRVMRIAMGVAGADDVSALRAFRRDLRDAFEHYRGPHASVDVLLSWATTRFRAVSVRHDARAAGESSYTLRALIRHAFNMLTGFSVLPLRIATIVGFAFMFAGFGLLLYVLVNYLLRGGVIQGFAFLASSISMFSGVQLFALGVIGEYVGRIYFHSMARPTYALRGTTDDADAGA